MSESSVEIPSGTLRGRVRVPSSKSVTHRALILALLGNRALEIERPLNAEDTRLTAAALVALGWTVEAGDSSLRLTPPDPTAAEASIDCGSSGTSLRLLMGALAATPGRWRLDGSPRLRERPVGALVAALESLGARVDWEAREGYPPLVVVGCRPGGGVVRIAAGESSQFVSGLLLAGTVAEAPVTIEVDDLRSGPYVELTVEAISRFGGHVRCEGGLYTVQPGLDPPERVVVDGDFSAAAYWAAGAALTGGSVVLEGLLPGSTQGDRRFLECLALMGARVDWEGQQLSVEGTGSLEALDQDLQDMPDQVPTLAAIAPFARGTTRIRNVPHLRLKESDRLGAMRCELERIGAEVIEHPDGLEIPGVWSEAAPPSNPVTVETWDDHRIAMSLAIAGLRRRNLSVDSPGVVAKSYPGFWRHLDRLLAG
jgi:3-phosphoshikimate 1-carboxyvinyltransferase